MIRNIFRKDPTNVGDWYCTPFRYFPLGDQPAADVYEEPLVEEGDTVVVGGGGLISENFAPYLERLAAAKKGGVHLIAWGIGESLINDKTGGMVEPWRGPLPDYLKKFDLVGVRDFGTDYEWVPCASCMLDLFDRDYPIEHEICIYEHRRIPVPIDCKVRRSNEGEDIAATIEFLGSAELVITNSYHGAYWATLLGRRVIAIPNLSKMYRFRHAPVVCAPSQWRDRASDTQGYPTALDDCRAANRQFNDKVQAVIGTTEPVGRAARAGA
jgi:hypothetical protein